MTIERDESAKARTERIDRWFLDRFGYRPSKAPVCPRVVAGKRCLVGDSRRHTEPDDVCVCRTFYSLLDHGQAWVSGRRQHAVTGEPYEIDDEQLEELRRRVEPWGLAVVVSQDSPWFPGHTKLVQIVRVRQ